MTSVEGDAVVDSMGCHFLPLRAGTKEGIGGPCKVPLAYCCLLLTSLSLREHISENK